MNAIATIPARTDATPVSLSMNPDELLSVLRTTLYPGASIDSIKLVVNACIASGKDPMLKPFHIVPMWVKGKDGLPDGYRDCIMPGINSYRVDAARTGQHEGTDEPIFGPDITRNLGGVDVTFPEWCKVVVRKRMPSGEIAEFPAVERWLENYATAGRETAKPNAMWFKRPYGQIAKCAEAQALRKGFPELGAAPTFEEMEGKETIDAEFSVVPEKKAIERPKAKEEPAADSAVVDGDFTEVKDKAGEQQQGGQQSDQRREPAQKRQQEQAPQDNGPLASAGLLATIANLAKKKNIHIDEARKQFNFAEPEDLTAAQATEVLNWVRAQDARK